MRLAVLTTMFTLLACTSSFAGEAKFSPAQLAKAPAKKLFATMRKASTLPPRVYGFYTKGCLAGGVEVDPTGPAWQVMRPHRNRAWGHPQLVKLVKRLAVEAKKHDGWNGLLVGDLAQPRGGPMLTGHRSHQVGLDADIWLNPMPDRILTKKERNTISAKKVVLDRKRIHPKLWTASHARLLKRAASYPQVQRIFVHPPIKKAMCDWARGQSDRSWLRKIRPYYGHNYHFHIRIRCPAGTPGCKSQPEPRPADGTGCGKELASWYSDKRWKKPKRGRPGKKPARFVNGIPLPRPKPPKPKPPRVKTLAFLPAACRQVLLSR